MKRFALYLPVLGIGVPILVGILLASAPLSSDAGNRPASTIAVPTVEDKGDTLPDNAAMERLAKEDPVAFLENCLRRYHREVHGYHLTMQKQERIAGRLQPKEIIDVYFREKPHSVLMIWREGARKAERALFVEGENEGKLLVRPSGSLIRKLAGDVVTRDVDGADARQSGRYPLNQFGIKKGTERTLAGWKASQARGQLRVEYLGVHQVKEAGDRSCFKLRRSYEAPESDGVLELTIYVDTETWLQVGSQIKGEEGKLIGEYFFRNIELNPTIKQEIFQADALR